MAKAVQIVQQKADDSAEFARDIVAAFETRAMVVGETVKDIHELMAGFRARRDTLSQALQEVLAGNESLRRKDFERMMSDIIAVQNEREGELREMLDNFRKEEETVAAKLKNLLGKGEGIGIKDFKRTIEEIKAGQDRRVTATKSSIAGQLTAMQDQVHAMLANFKAERESVAHAWHELLGFLPTTNATAEPRTITKDTEQSSGSQDS